LHLLNVALKPFNGVSYVGAPEDSELLSHIVAIFNVFQHTKSSKIFFIDHKKYVYLY